MFRLAILLLVGLTGCTPSTVVRKNPGDFDRGIRFYRPKPYLLIAPAGGNVTVKETEKGGESSKETVTTTGNSDRFVSIRLEYLPDFSEEYSISVRPGFGVNNTEITLTDGWNLTAVNQQLDSQTDENVAAAAELVGAISQAFGATGSSGIKTNNDQFSGGSRPVVVKATNVPLGYYEAILSDYNGKKRLYGWRYVGFAPYLQCPTEGFNDDCIDCCESDEIFGLVFREGVMTFAPLRTMKNTKGHESIHSPFPGPVQSSASQPETSQMEAELLSGDGEPIDPALVSAVRKFAQVYLPVADVSYNSVSEQWTVIRSEREVAPPEPAVSDDDIKNALDNVFDFIDIGTIEVKSPSSAQSTSQVPTYDFYN